MKDFLFIFLTGLFAFLTGIFSLKREIRLFEDTVNTTAKVVKYDEYMGHPTTITMYTMVVEYYLSDGKLMHAKEQSSTNRQKYAVGTELKITYSKERPDLFILYGSNSRKIIMVGMIVVGLAMMMAAIGVAALNS